MLAIWRSRLFQSAPDDVDADLLVAVEVQIVQKRDELDEGRAAAGDDAFFDRRTGGRQRIFDAMLLLFQLSLGGRADLDDGDAAGELGEPLLQLLFVVVGVGLVNLGLDLRDAALNGLRRPCLRQWWCRLW